MLRRSNVSKTRFMGYSGGQSFSFDSSFLDDRPPLLDLGFLKIAEPLRGLSVTRKNLLPEVGEPRPYLRVGNCLHDCAIYLGNDILRRALGQPKPMPLRDVEPGHPRLV